MTSCFQCSSHLNVPVTVSYNLELWDKIIPISFKLLSRGIVSHQEDELCGWAGYSNVVKPVVGFRVDIPRESPVVC